MSSLIFCVFSKTALTLHKDCFVALVFRAQTNSTMWGSGIQAIFLKLDKALDGQTARQLVRWKLYRLQRRVGFLFSW